MNKLKAWHVVVAVLCAVVGAAAIGLYYKHEQSVQAAAAPNAARIQRVDGEVGINNALPQGASNAAGNEWVAASANQPFTVGHRIYTRERAHASLAFNGRNFARLDPNTELDAITLTDDRTQLALRDGSAIFDVGYLAPNELFEVGTPYGAVDFSQPGLYNVGIDNGNATVSCLNGQAQVVGLGSNGRISKGQMFTLLGAAAANVALSRLDGRNAGYLVDDYYRYQYPNVYDGRYSNYDAYLNDPNYFDPYRRNISYKYVTYEIPGVDDLDAYGDWQNVSGYGNCWRPRVDTAWAPYQDGYWTNDYPYGPTWVSSEPWGYAPYHYGRWADVGNQWFWIPEAINTTPRYAPALVAFVPFQQDQIGWVPLGPSDPYVARYYNDNWQPVYLNRGSIAPTNLANINVPGAVTVVPIANFGNHINPRTVSRIDPRSLAQVRSTLDPLTLTPLRNAVMHSAWGRGRMDLPPGIAKKLDDTRVVMGTTPVAPPFRKDLAGALRVDAAPARNQQFNQQRAVATQATTQPAEAARRQQQIDPLAAEAARGNRDARRQERQLERQQKTDQIDQQKAQVAQQRAQVQQQRAQTQQARVQEQSQRRVAQQAQGVKVGQPARQAEAPRQQAQRTRTQPQPRVAAQPERVSPPARRAAPPPPPRAERVANPVKPPAAARPQVQQRTQPPPPQRSAARQAARPQPQSAPKQERKQQGPPPHSPGGGGKEKDKHP
jgi:hypothetical protein